MLVLFSTVNRFAEVAIALSPSNLLFKDVRLNGGDDCFVTGERSVY